jgi:phosphohistidine phosphatase
MELFILRHAIADQRDPTKYPDDALRPLTEKGMKRMRRVAEGLLAAGLQFDVIYTSPYTRAKQTAEIVAEVFDMRNDVRETDTLAVDGDPEDLIEELKKTEKDAASVLLVGHEPYLSELISLLLVGDASLDLTMKKGGVCKLTVGMLKYGKCATLDWLIPPSLSTRLR